MTDAANESTQVVVVDDSPFFRSIMRAALEEEGYVCLTAETGESAVSVITEAAPNVALIVLDLMLPDMTGFHVVEKLRKESATRAIPIVVVTSYGVNDLEREILKRGDVKAVLSKAASLEQILFEIRGTFHPDENELRKTPRVPLGLSVTVHRENATQLTTTFNLSEGGMFLVLADREPPNIGDKLELKFWIPGADGIFEMPARVVWVNSPESLRRENPPGFAVEFIEPDEATVAAIRSFIASNT